MTNIHAEPAFHPEYMGVFERLMRDVGARERPVRQAAVDSQQALSRLNSERHLLAGQGQGKAANDLIPKIREQNDVLQAATRQLKAFEEERESIANSSHPEIRATIIRLNGSAPARMRAKQEAEYEEAHTAFTRLVPLDVQAAFERLTRPLITPEVQAAAVRLRNAALAIDRDPSTLTKTLVIATAAPGG